MKVLISRESWILLEFNPNPKLLPPTKQLAKERRENDSSQFVKNYLDFFGAKKTAKVLRNNLKITRDALVDMFETTKLLKIQIGNITNSLKRKGGKDGKKKGGGLGGLGGDFGGPGEV